VHPSEEKQQVSHLTLEHKKWVGKKGKRAEQTSALPRECEKALLYISKKKTQQRKGGGEEKEGKREKGIRRDKGSQIP